ncbi:uncharacterized protein LOC110114555 [Dendrobium catenatum]|uniref:uncharacterized protein LOC110114555 n=1 Tax=Dendrobium catenatum TaxID=906689 RepID=UPI0009F2ADC7|nr:uncharacterized protein LOC110114555 [Dendrobium catenatum]
MAASSTVFSLAGGVHINTCSLHSNKLKTLGGYHLQLEKLQSSKQSNRLQRFPIHAEYGSRGGGGDFIAGFLLGGAVFGTLAYVFAPQIRRSLLNEDESGFQRARRPIYSDNGLEKTRQTLNTKISQLNSAIDNVSSRLRGGNNSASDLVEADSELETNR